MITFNAGAWRFNYRVGGVKVRDGHVLLMRIGSEKFWFVPGGRIEGAEPAKAALEREVAEELGVVGQIGRMLWAVALAPRGSESGRCLSAADYARVMGLADEAPAAEAR